MSKKDFVYSPTEKGNRKGIQINRTPKGCLFEVKNDLEVITLIECGLEPFVSVAALVTMPADPPAANEGDIIPIIITRSEVTTTACSVVVNTQNGTGIAGVDFTGITNQTVSFGIGELTKTVNISLLTPGGGVRQFSVVLSNPIGCSILDNSVTVSII